MSSKRLSQLTKCCDLVPPNHSLCFTPSRPGLVTRFSRPWTHPVHSSSVFGMTSSVCVCVCAHTCTSLQHQLHVTSWSGQCCCPARTPWVSSASPVSLALRPHGKTGPTPCLTPTHGTNRTLYIYIVFFSKEIF